jgi:hypothetical protein
MSPLSLEDAVAIEGGSLVLGSSLPGLPSLAIGEASATVYFLVRVYSSTTYKTARLEYSLPSQNQADLHAGCGNLATAPL